MDREELITAVSAALGEVLEREVGELAEDVRLADDLHLDSTSMLELLMGLEETVGLEVDPETLDIEDFATVGTLVSFVQRTSAVQAAAR